MSERKRQRITRGKCCGNCAYAGYNASGFTGICHRPARKPRPVDYYGNCYSEITVGRTELCQFFAWSRKRKAVTP